MSERNDKMNPKVFPPMILSLRLYLNSEFITKLFSDKKSFRFKEVGSTPDLGFELEESWGQKKRVLEINPNTLKKSQL